MEEYAPIREMLKAFSRKKKYLFCMPAHKGKEGENDITELGFSDNLHSPAGVIKESQNIAAKIFGAKKCFYITTGSTTSIFIMLCAAKKFGSKIIIAKSSHKSVYNALGIFNIEPVIVDDFNNIENFLANGVIGALITYPDYFGRCIDIKKVYQTLKKHNKLLLSDSSHGGHFNENINLINPNKYSDICCFSAFKTLSGLTQGSYLLLNNLELEDEIKNAFNAIHTTSPSYIILESLERATLDLEKNKTKLKSIQEINRIKSMDGLVFEKNDDILKLILNVENLNITGFLAEKFLNNINIYPEFSTFTQVVFIFSYCEKIKNLKKLTAGLNKLKQHNFNKEQFLYKPDFNFIDGLSYLKAINSQTEFVDIENCAKRISACNLGMYPPAVPVLIAGQIITQEFADYMLRNIDKFFNVSNGKVKVVLNTKN